MLACLAMVAGMLSHVHPCAHAARVDFEDFESGTLLRDQLVPIGLRVVGVGASSGLVYEEGESGTQNYGNSATHILDIGERDQPTTFRFVSPSNPDQIVGALSFSVLIGDGNVDEETFTLTCFDLSGNELVPPSTFTTDQTGIRVGETSLSVGGLIGSIELRLADFSPSGVTLDDLEFELAHSVLGDTDGDGDVDLDDLNNVRNHFGGTGPGDANGDGQVDLNDLNAVRNNFGTAGSKAVAEPSTFGLIVFGSSSVVFLSMARLARPAGRGVDL
jgi:hypothetical protein